MEKKTMKNAGKWTTYSAAAATLFAGIVLLAIFCFKEILFKWGLLMGIVALVFTVALAIFFWSRRERTETTTVQTARAETSISSEWDGFEEDPEESTATEDEEPDGELFQKRSLSVCWIIYTLLLMAILFRAFLLDGFGGVIRVGRVETDELIVGTEYVSEQYVDDQSVENQSVNNGYVEKQTVKDQTVENQTVVRQTVKDSYVERQTVRDQTVEKQTVVNQTVLTTRKSETTTKKPETTTKKVETTTKKVETTTKKPETTTKKVETTTQKPETTTKKVETTTQKPETTTKKVETTTQKPETTTKKVETTTELQKSLRVDGMQKDRYGDVLMQKDDTVTVILTNMAVSEVQMHYSLNGSWTSDGLSLNHLYGSVYELVVREDLFGMSFDIQIFNPGTGNWITVTLEPQY